MKKHYITSMLLLVIPLLLTAQQPIGISDIEAELYKLPDIIFKAAPDIDGFEAVYEFYVLQPLDHNAPEKGSFYQKGFLSHRGFDRPTVINTAGYHTPRNRIYEPTELLQANQVRLEHRFFAGSTPMPVDWQYLNMEQVTADLHKVRTLFGEIYKGKWVSTGISKGGMTAIYYKYYYPEDVAAAIPYVAPIDTAFEDQRIYTFLDEVGSKKCRKKLEKIQYRLFKDKDKVLTRLKWYHKAKGSQFNYLSLEEAYEYAVLEYPFSFWQYGGDCTTIPKANADLETIIDHFNNVVGLDFYTDNSMQTFAAHYYQTATETGYYGYKRDGFEKYLEALPAKPHATFTPDKMELKYDPTLSLDVFEWTQTKGNNLIYIYGSTDTWTAAGVPESDKVDALWFILENKNHSTARIGEMTDKDHQKLVDTLERWLEIEIE